MQEILAPWGQDFLDPVNTESQMPIRVSVFYSGKD